MPAAKVDALLEQLEAHQDSLAGIKAGDALIVLQSDGNLACAKPDGSVVGLLPANVAPQLRQGSFVATVRSVKRQGESVTQLQVRLTPGEPPSDPGGRGSWVSRQVHAVRRHATLAADISSKQPCRVAGNNKTTVPSSPSFADPQPDTCCGCVRKASYFLCSPPQGPRSHLLLRRMRRMWRGSPRSS